jgi:hypothetical protein
MVERRIELDRRYHRKEKMRKLKAKLQTATGADREKILYKIKRLSPFWTEASLTQTQATPASAAKSEEPKEPKKKAPPKPKAEKKPAPPPAQ